MIGSDSTSTAISSSLFYLLHNPTALKQLAHLVRSKFSSLEDIRPSSPQISPANFPYLRACINEALRLSPPTSAPPRKVLAGGLVINDEETGRKLPLPEGTVVAVSHYAIHHNEAYFPQSFNFNPERWIVETGLSEEADSKFEAEEAKVALAKSAFCPFSIGPRACIARNMAYSELSVTVARLLWLYDLKLAEGQETIGDGNGCKTWGGLERRKGEYQLRDWVTAAKDGPIVQFKLREPRL